jgi:hypothetical protein
MRLNPAPAAAALSLLAAADLQDNLLMVANDLERLQTLLSDACDTLLAGFGGASAALRGRAGAEPAIDRAIGHLGTAIVALQFHDMGSQLINHTQQRLRHCADRLAQEAFQEDEDGETAIAPLPLCPNPVTQDEMDAGSVTLF